MKTGIEIKKQKRCGKITKSKMIFSMLLAIMLAFGMAGCKPEGKETSEAKEPDALELIGLCHYFNGAPEKLTFGRVIEESFTDQGVTIKYLASFFDGEATYLFLELTDDGANLFPKGSRDFLLESYDFIEKGGYNDSRDYSLLTYDPTTKTETLCVEYIGPLNRGDLTFHIYSMSGNQQAINALPEIDLYNKLNDDPGKFVEEDEFGSNSTSFSIANPKTGAPEKIIMPEFEEGNQPTVHRLAEGTMSLPIKDKQENAIADITNIGWKDGWLHVQIKPRNGIEWWGMMNLNLENRDTGEMIYSPFNMTYGEEKYGEGSSDYDEYVFYVGELTKENLHYKIVMKNQYHNATNLKGDWKIRFSIPDAMLKNLDVSKGVPVNGQELKLERAVASPVKISLFASAKGIAAEKEDWFRRIDQNDLTIKVIEKGGKAVEVPGIAVQLLGNQKGQMFRISYTSEDFEHLEGVEVNGVLLPVEE